MFWSIVYFGLYIFSLRIFWSTHIRHNEGGVVAVIVIWNLKVRWCVKIII